MSPKAHRAGANGRITFIEADAQSMPLPSNAFQIVGVAFGPSGELAVATNDTAYRFGARRI